jgi:hypothetical protein
MNGLGVSTEAMGQWSSGRVPEPGRVAAASEVMRGDGFLGVVVYLLLILTSTNEH